MNFSLILKFFEMGLNIAHHSSLASLLAVENDERKVSVKGRVIVTGGIQNKDFTLN